MEFTSDFEREVFEGLNTYPKSLPSKYIYDPAGDRLFQQITELPEYYLTRCEWELFHRHKQHIASYLNRESEWDIVELGAGDGKKTRILLEAFLQEGIRIAYRPIDISSNALELVSRKMKEALPDLPVIPLNGTYFETLEDIGRLKDRRKLVLFLGSNIGNLLHPQAVEFLTELGGKLNPGDLLLIGFDLKKDPKTIRLAYSDPTGVTEAFNKNLLLRINRELGGDFDPDHFIHWESYDPETGTCRSFLISTRSQSVRIDKLGTEFRFDPWETIHTEISQKYDHEVIHWLSDKAGLQIIDSFRDGKQWYANYLFGLPESLAGQTKNREEY